MRLRAASEADRDFFFSVRRDTLGPYVEELSGWDETQQRRQADQEFDELPIEIVESGGAAIGYLCVLHNADHDYLDEIALASPAQGTGLGSTLVRGVMDHAARRGVPIRLSVLVNNPARRLYERLGFRIVRVDHPRVRMEWP